MDDLSAQRTLVKSPPELWAEISDVDSLARHLGEFGEIRITQLEPETTVAWEGDRIRGTVCLEPAGWGTKVTLAAELTAVEAIVAETEAAVEPEAVAEVAVVEIEADAAVASDAVVEAEAMAAEPEPVVEAEPEPAPVVEAEPEPAPVVEATVADAPEPAPAKPGFFARLFGKHRGMKPVAEVPPTPAPEPAPEPDPVPEPQPDPVPPPVEPDPGPVVPDPSPTPAPPEPGPPAPDPGGPVLDADGAQAILVSVLDDLGSAHHRPFSRG